MIELKDLSSLNVHRARNGNMTLKDAVDAFEQQYIKAMLDSVGGNKTKAAEILGIHRNTLLLKTSGCRIKEVDSRPGQSFSELSC